MNSIQKRHQYTIAEKKAYVEKYYQIIQKDSWKGIKTVARELGIAKSTLEGWIDQYKFLKEVKGAYNKYRLEGEETFQKH